MKFIKLFLMLIAGAVTVAVTAYVLNLIHHYEFICAGPIVVGAAGGGAVALSSLVARKERIGMGVVSILLLLVVILGFAIFKRFEYEAWRGRLIQAMSERDARFANLPLSEKEQILNEELEVMTGHTGYLSYLMFPRYDFDLDIEITEGAEIPIHFKFYDKIAVGFKFIITILEAFFSCGAAAYIYFEAFGDWTLEE